ncbi:acyl-CoA dehydrogenase family protein [Catenulispora yoronensis]|uniref:Acyl-CoA dehydrogenase family protein n=1 Tax=Catenulispora yoronensis TaxID=450799 RepID=A0ABP5GTD5_9ACTN
MTATTQERTAFADLLVRLGPELSDGHLDDDRDHRFRRDKWRRLAEVGLLGLPFPAEYGGAALDVADTVGILRALGEHCLDQGLVFSATTQLASTGTPLARFGSEPLKARYLPGVCAGELIGAHAITESGGGSDALAMRTTARHDGDAYVLSGAKAYVSNGPVADLIVVYARTGTGATALTPFLVRTDSPGVVRGAPIEKMGLRTSPMCELFLDDVRVPDDHVLGYEGGGLLVLDYVMKREILYSFAATVGRMAGRLERLIGHANTRESFGAPIAAYQAVSHRIADLKIGYETSRLWLEHTAAALAAHRDVAEDIAITKLVASEAAVASAQAAVQLFGGAGYMSEYGLEKELRDNVAATIYSGSSEIQRDRLAALVGLRTRKAGR